MKKLVVLMLLLLVGCTTKTEPVNISFYFWRTNFSLSATEETYLKELNVQKLYIRYFDVALQNNAPVPVAPIVFTSKPTNYKIVPVVYIKNEVFLKPIATDSLAQNVYNYIQQINKSAEVTVDEIQFDCDWSLQSKEHYFAFIEAFKKHHTHLSATIRLHQIKYPQKTGVPKVNLGTLMYYNMGTIDANNENSIYTQTIAHKYIRGLQNYKLPLNIALPIFSWGVHIREQKVINLIGGLQAQDFTTDVFEKISDNRYKVIDDIVYKGRFLAKNDEIKLEAVTTLQLKEMMADIKKYSTNKPNEIIFYDLNEKNLKAYEKEDFKTVSRW